LGCGVGDVAALLSIRGARVVGIDMNEEVLAAARDRDIPGAEFHSADNWPCAFWGALFFIISDNVEREYAMQSLMENTQLFEEAVARNLIKLALVLPDASDRVTWGGPVAA
jgi:trans-aconitate methyltransferase